MVVIAGDFGFPLGGAPAARVRNLALGFRAAGEKVHIVALSDADGSDQTSYVETWGDGLTLEHPPVRFTRPRAENRSLGDRLNWLSKVYRGSWAMARRFHSFNRGGQGGICLLYGRSYARLWPFVRAAREKKMTLLLDVVEGVERFAGFGGALSPVRWDWALGAGRLPLLVDGVTAISYGLAERCRQQGARSVKLLPGIESWSAGMKSERSGPSAKFRLVHVGALLRKDAPGELVEFVRHLRSQQIPVEIHLCGRYEQSPEGRRWLAKLQEADRGGNPILRYLGAVSAEEMETVLGQADGFLLFRADTPAERISFPTRLVEYLRRGSPVFVNAIGDIPRYLEDGRNAVFLPSGNAQAAAEKVRQFVAQPGRLQEIGLAGWARGRECFDRDTHAAEVLTWAGQLNQGYDQVG